MKTNKKPPKKKATPQKVEQSQRASIKNSMTVVELGAIDRLYPEEVKDDQLSYVLLGTGNEYVKYLEELVTETTVHGTLVTRIAKMAIGDGFTYDEAYGRPDPNMEYLLESWKEDRVNGFSGNDTCKAAMRNLKTHGNAFIEVSRVWNVETRAFSYYVRPLPNECCALGKRNGQGEIDFVWVSKDFDDNKEQPKPYPLFNHKSNKWKTSIIWLHLEVVGKDYYAKPDYVGNTTYIEVERGMAEYHGTTIESGFTPTHVLNLATGLPTPDEEKAAIKKVHDKYTGTRGRRVIVTFSRGQDEATTVQQIQSGDVDKQFTQMATNTRENTFISHSVTSPILFGIRDGAGLGNNADEIHAAWKLFEMTVLKDYREVMVDGFAPLFRLMGITFPLAIKSYDMEWLNMSNRTEITQSKRPELSSVVIGKEEAKDIIAHLKKVGKPVEYYTDRGCVLVHTEDVDLNDINRPEHDYVTLAIESDPDLPSRLDVKDGNRGTWLVRYKYHGPLDDRNRDYCHEMMKMNLLYRKEDIDQMSFRGENKEFGRYSIWRFKGSYGCRHKWQRVLFYLDNEDGDINRVGNVPKVVKDLPDEEATRVNTKPRRFSNTKLYKLLRTWLHS